MLTHCLPILSILIITGTILNNIFKYNYLKNQTSFSIFYCFIEVFIKLRTFGKKESASQLKYLQYYWLRRTRLLKCLEVSVENTLRQSKCQQVSNTAESWLKALLSSFSPIRDKLCSKVSLLLRAEIIGLFVNTLTAHYKCSGQYKGNFAQPIQIQWSINQRFFLQFFMAFLK